MFFVAGNLADAHVLPWFTSAFQLPFGRHIARRMTNPYTTADSKSSFQKPDYNIVIAWFKRFNLRATKTHPPFSTRNTTGMVTFSESAQANQ